MHFSVIPKLYITFINVQSNTEQELTGIFPIFILKMTPCISRMKTNQHGGGGGYDS